MGEPIYQGFSRDISEMVFNDLSTVVEDLQTSPPAQPKHPGGQFHLTNRYARGCCPYRG